MRWFRRNICLGSRLALFALIMQLGLSFGHVHVDGAAGGSRAAFQTTVASGEQGADVVSGGPSTPANHTNSIDDCAICASIHLAGTVLLAEAPSLPLRIAPSSAPRGWQCETGFACSQIAFFEARAPPLF